MKTESIDQYLYRKHTGQSAKSYLFSINNFLASNPQAKKYMYKDIVKCFADLKLRYNNVSTVNSILAGVKRYYDYLVETKQRNDHPCKMFRIKGDASIKKRQMQFQDLFTSKELELLLKRESRFIHLKLRNKIIISLLIYQALTCDDITRIDIEDVDLDKGTVYIKSSGKLASRTIELNRLQIEYIEDYLRLDRKQLLKVSTNRLLIGIRGTPETVESIGGMLEPLKSFFPERSLNAITIRQSVISNWLNKDNHPLDKVQLWAGHRWPSSTQRYRRIDESEQREKINKWHPLK
jgi:site-specific recombinase XerD